MSKSEVSPRDPLQPTGMRPARRLSILITNLMLTSRSGTEVVVRDLALHLRRRGHEVSILAPGGVGELGEEIRANGALVFDDVSAISQRPDIIHGHHSVPTMLAMAQFPDVPAVWMSHDFRYWFDEPPKLSNVLRYLPVDETRRKFLVQDRKIREGLVEVLFNSVDLERIPPRTRPLPQTPQRILAFTKTQHQIDILQKFCADRGLLLDSLGRGVKREIARPEEELIQNDIVVATGRSAIEALCAGASVIVGDARGFAGLVTLKNYDHYRAHNFGSELFTRAFSETALAEAFADYDPENAIAVTMRIRREADLVSMLDRLESIYFETMEQPRRSNLSAADRSELWETQRDWPMGKVEPWLRHRKVLRRLVRRAYLKASLLRFSMRPQS